MEPTKSSPAQQIGKMVSTAAQTIQQGTGTEAKALKEIATPYRGIDSTLSDHITLRHTVAGQTQSKDIYNLEELVDYLSTTEGLTQQELEGICFRLFFNQTPEQIKEIIATIQKDLQKPSDPTPQRRATEALLILAGLTQTHESMDKLFSMPTTALAEPMSTAQDIEARNFISNIFANIHNILEKWVADLTTKEEILPGLKQIFCGTVEAQTPQLLQIAEAIRTTTPPEELSSDKSLETFEAAGKSFLTTFKRRASQDLSNAIAAKFFASKADTAVQFTGAVIDFVMKCGSAMTRAVEDLIRLLWEKAPDSAIKKAIGALFEAIKPALKEMLDLLKDLPKSFTKGALALLGFAIGSAPLLITAGFIGSIIGWYLAALVLPLVAPTIPPLLLFIIIVACPIGLILADLPFSISLVWLITNISEKGFKKVVLDDPLSLARGFASLVEEWTPTGEQELLV